MIKPETTGRRPTAYSEFHRFLGSGCYAVDIDFVEYRAGKGVVGFFAVTGNLVDERHMMNSKPYIWKRTKLERKILHFLSVNTGLPAFFVIHNNDLDVFHVHRIGEDLGKFKVYDRDSYASFIKNL